MLKLKKVAIFSSMIVLGLSSVSDASEIPTIDETDRSGMQPMHEYGNYPGQMHPFDYNDTRHAQSALQDKRFCGAIDNELVSHFPPPTMGKTYFCKKGTITSIADLKEELAGISLQSCQKDTEHAGYQRCNSQASLKEIEGCTGIPNVIGGTAHDNKKTNVVTILFDPVNNCIVTAFPPLRIHLNEACSADCKPN